MDSWYIAVLQFDFVHEVVFAVSGNSSGVVELYIYDFAFSAV